MYSDLSRQLAHTVQLTVPKLWRSFSGLDTGNNCHQFIAKNYDQLVDSPIETGINVHHEFTVDNRKYELVIWGEGNYDSNKIVKDLKILVTQSKQIWQGYPFQRYVLWCTPLAVLAEQQNMLILLLSNALALSSYREKVTLALLLWQPTSLFIH